MPTPLRHPKKVTRVPGYRRHPNGQAFVQIRGERIYLGKHGTEQSRKRYAEEIAKIDIPRPAYSPADKAGAGYTLVELCANYLDFAEGYYRKHGEETETAGEVGRVTRLLSDRYGETPAADFGPAKLKRIVQGMVDTGLCRTTVNSRLGIVKRMYRWAVAEELVPAPTWQALLAVEGPRKGRTAAKEPEPVEPVDDEVVDRTVEFLPEVVADMVRFERLTGARPGEVCDVRPGDVDRSGEIWIYRPGSHKAEHHGRGRIVCIGPKAQDVLRKYLLRAEDDWCFSPRECVAKWLEAKHGKRKTPLSCGNRPGSNRRRWPKRRAGKKYTPASYRRAIERAVKKLNAHLVDQAAAAGDPAPVPVPKWTPNQLRHTSATEIRGKFGLEAAQVTLGHAKANVTEVYAERDLKLAMEVAKRIG